MPVQPDRHPGTREEDAIEFTEIASQPNAERTMQFVQNNGMEIFVDGVARGIGEGRVNVFQFPVDDRDVNSPPGSPTTGYRVIVGDSPTGDFTGYAGEIAQYNGSSWVFTTPQHGMIAFVRDENEPYAQRSSSSPWDWRRVYAKTHWGSEDDEASTNSATWVVFLRVPDTGTLDLESGDYRLLATILAWGTSVATQVGLRVREDETTTLCENAVVPDVTGDAKQPCIAMKILESLSGGHYYTLEFNRTSAPGVAYVSNGTLTLQRI